MSSAEAVINKCIVPASPHEGICVLHACYRCDRDALPTELRPQPILPIFIDRPLLCGLQSQGQADLEIASKPATGNSRNGSTGHREFACRGFQTAAPGNTRLD